MLLFRAITPADAALMPHAATLIFPDPTVDHQQLLIHMIQQGSAQLAENEDGQIVGMAGLVMMWRGVAQAWLMMDQQQSLAMRMCVAKQLSRQLELWRQQYRLHRLQAYVHHDYPLGQRLVQWLGFRHESRLVAFDAMQNDWDLYVMLEGD